MRISSLLKVTFILTLVLIALVSVLDIRPSLAASSLNVRSTLPRASAPQIMVDLPTVIEDTHGNMIAILYGKALLPNTYYQLTDTNTSCSYIAQYPTTVEADQHGRFAFPLNGGPIFGNAQCTPGTYLITAQTGTTKISTTYTVKAPKRFSPTHVFINPKTVVEVTQIASFITLLYGRGFPANIPVNFQGTNVPDCLQSYNTSMPTTDGKGNFSISFFGDPYFTSYGSPACPSGSYTATVVVGSTTYTLPFVLK